MSGRRLAWAAGLAILIPGPASAHGFAGTGWLHPLTGPDHMLAMVLVGAWSAQLGGRALWTVPAAFVAAMAAGALAARLGLVLPGTEAVIALSSVALGLAVALARPVRCLSRRPRPYASAGRTAPRMGSRRRPVRASPMLSAFSSPPPACTWPASPGRAFCSIRRGADRR